MGIQQQKGEVVCCFFSWFCIIIIIITVSILVTAVSISHPLCLYNTSCFQNRSTLFAPPLILSPESKKHSLQSSMCLFFRIAYLGLTLSLRSFSFVICIPGFILLSRQLKKEERNALHGTVANGGTELEALRKEEFVISNSDQSQRKSDNGTDRETRL